MLAPPSSQRDRTFLLTTARSEHSLSPFINLTIELNNLMHSRGSGTNYKLWHLPPVFDPPGSLEEVLTCE